MTAQEPPGGERRGASDQHGQRTASTVDLPGRAPAAVTFADVQPEAVTWLWAGRLPAGKLVMLDGDPSLGKSTLAITLAAHVSTGRPWPDGAECVTGDVVVLSAEDGLADTVRPRLDAAEGDAARVHALNGVRVVMPDGSAYTRPVTLADLDVIRAQVAEVAARLLVVDVLMAYLPRTDAHRDQDMRSLLSPLGTLADETGCTVLMLRHLNKAAGMSAMHRGGGSIGIIGAARAAFLVAPDPDDPSGEARVLATVKSNLAVEAPALRYRLESAPESHVARVVWLGESRHRADALLDGAGGDERADQDDASAWLLAYLAERDGSAAVPDIVKAARGAGIAERTLRRVRTRAGVVSVRSGFPARAVWHAPVRPEEGQSGQFGQSGSVNESGHSGQLGHSGERSPTGQSGRTVAEQNMSGPCMWCGVDVTIPVDPNAEPSPCLCTVDGAT